MLIFLDTETTGLEDNDKICSIATIYTSENTFASRYELINEGKKISFKASSINHITNEMLQNKVKLIDSDIYAFLNEYNNSETTIVGHNINFDMQKLCNAGFHFKGTLIDTLRVTKHLVPECESYALQVLRYELKLYKSEKKEALKCGLSENIIAHHASFDALLVKLLYDYLVDIASHEEMKELSFKNVLLEKFSFGKYAGRYIEDIMMNDRGYLEWMLSSIVDLDDDLRYSINYYLQG